jgi:hypothetical protein
MPAYQWTSDLRPIFDHACQTYREGCRSPEAMFSLGHASMLSSIGLRPINLYDYAEDCCLGGEPDWDTVLLIAAARRDYFLYQLGGTWPEDLICESDLPLRKDEWDGIAWLPRISMKARCFLEGTLCTDVMYFCGGDRQFLRSQDLHPADFLRLIWSAREDRKKILDFVRGR